MGAKRTSSFKKNDLINSIPCPIKCPSTLSRPEMIFLEILSRFSSRKKSLIAKSNKFVHAILKPKCYRDMNK